MTVNHTFGKRSTKLANGQIFSPNKVCNDDDGIHLSDEGSKQPVTINITPSKAGPQTVNIILTDGSARKQRKDTEVTDSKLYRHRKNLME